MAFFSRHRLRRVASLSFSHILCHADSYCLLQTWMRGGQWCETGNASPRPSRTGVRGPKIGGVARRKIRYLPASRRG